MNVMSTIAQTATNLRAVADEATKLARVDSDSWTPSHTERLLRLGSAASEAATGVTQLKSVNFTGKYASVVHDVFQGGEETARGLTWKAQSTGTTVAVSGRSAISYGDLRALAERATPLADSMQAIRNLVYRP